MNPMIMLYSLIAMVNTTPAVSFPTQHSAVAATTVDSITPPLLTDDLLLRWHSALIHFGDTLIAHPELKQANELTPLWRPALAFCGTWVGRNTNDTSYLSDSPLKELDSAKKKTLSRQTGLPGFPIDDIVKAIVQQPTLVGAIRTSNLTPEQFVATTSAIEQTRCAVEAGLPHDQQGKMIDTSDNLGKNIAYLWTWKDKKGQNPRMGRTWDQGLRDFFEGIHQDKRAINIYKRIEDMRDMNEVLNADGTEKPLQ